MAMSKRDYQAVALVIREARWEAKTSAPGEPEVDLSAPEVNAVLVTTTKLAVELAGIFQNENDRFDREVFIKACGISDEKNVTGDWKLILDRRR